MIAGGLIVLWAAVEAPWLETISAEQYLAQPSDFQSKKVQIYGKVVPDSIEPADAGVNFRIYSGEKDFDGTQPTLAVYYSAASVNLRPNTGVLLRCRIGPQGEVTILKVLTKCPSRYINR